MPLTLEAALNSYGFVGQLASAIPDLKGILDRAIAGEWVPDQFRRAMMDSPWYKSNAESVRNLVQLQATDPATYEQNLNNAAQKVYLTAQQMGRMGPGFDSRGIAMQALLNNWDDQQIRSYLGTFSNGEHWSPDGGPKALVGEAGQLETHLRKLAGDYGVSITQDYVNQALNFIQGGHETIDGYENLIRARAKAQYPHLAAQIDAGMSVRDVADPYIATMAQTLEMPETGIDLTDPAIQRALQVRDPASGAFSNKPMWQFQRELKDDPRWDKTVNARTEAYSMASLLGKSWGFLS